jgi:hypothetical protein
MVERYVEPSKFPGLPPVANNRCHRHRRVSVRSALALFDFALKGLLAGYDRYEVRRHFG